MAKDRVPIEVHVKEGGTYPLPVNMPDSHEGTYEMSISLPTNFRSVR